jgi:AcrR family transcriptional regulator
MNDELQNILRKVLTLYRKYGIRSVTMDDISHELGISKKTLYQYVHDKDELVTQVVDMEIAERQERMMITCQDNKNAIEQLLEIALCISVMLKDYSPSTEYDLKKYYPDLYLKVRNLRRSHIYKFLLENLNKGKEEGLYRNEIDVGIISKLNVSIIDGIIDSEVITIHEFLSQRFFSEFFVYHIRGIANVNGLDFLDKQLHQLEFHKLKEPKVTHDES